ncbi:MAG: SDR family NAD(P)-dependent oxidoreductase [Geminicoccaceae bacterium]|nr:SDR family NAD(P)-dependent oxidoreductase [Geminicoccaceae bacterium]
MRNPKPWNPGHVLLTGASSGIGAALAGALAAPGRRLTLMGRDGARLAAVAALCAGKGATVETRAADVTDAGAMRAAVEAAPGPIDLVVANAGVSGSAGGTRRIFAVNLEGLVNTVEPAIARMRTQGFGQIGIVSSLASFKGFPNAPAYCASKAAARLYGEGLRGRLRPQGIAVSVICPGFVRTPLTTDNPFPMPFLMEPEEAARRIVEGLAADRARIAFPRRLYWPTLWLSLLPPGLTDRLGSEFQVKEK